MKITVTDMEYLKHIIVIITLIKSTRKTKDMNSSEL